MPRIRRRLVLIALAILTTLLVGTTGFVLIERYPPFDAFYMSLVTITTVGYKEVYELSTAGRIFNSFLILFGVSVMFLAVGAMTQTIIELELGRYFEKRQVRRMVEKLKDHYIVCGYGKVGRGAVTELKSEGVPLVIIERDEHKVENAIRDGLIAVLGDATRDDNLRSIGIMHAKGLIAALSSDADNLFLVLSAKGLNPKLVVSARVIEEEAEQKLKKAGADLALASYNITGSRLAQAILRPHVVQFLDLATTPLGAKIGIEQVRVGQSSWYVAKSLGESQLRRETGVIILAIRKADGPMLFNPDANTQLYAGDFLIAMGEAPNLRKLEHLLTGVPVR
jgi:voltage-gated potassium channel